MKIAVYTRSEQYLSDSLLSQLLESASACGVGLLFSSSCVRATLCGGMERFDSLFDVADSVDLILSLGGDGTFLSCVAELKGKETPILGVNSGRLGFLSSVDASEAENVIERVASGDYMVEHHMMLSVDGSFDKTSCFPHAFNEFTIKSNVGLMTVSLSVDGMSVADYSADGLIVSTPTGSTAYSMSVGGPIMTPECEAFIINPIAPHNLSMRPLVVGPSSVMELVVNARGTAIATLDNRSFETVSGDRFVLRRSTKRAVVVKFEKGALYSALRRKLKWGVNII